MLFIKVEIVDLIKTLLSEGHQYVLPRRISSYRTEGEFGIYLQSSGGNFLISAEQVFSGLQIQRIKLFSKLDIHVEGENIDSDCCKNVLKDSEEDLNLVEQCFDAASNLNSTKKASLYYIYGYVARKAGIVCDDKPPESLPESEFTEKLSRGGLSIPPIDLYDISLYYNAFLKSKSVKCCAKIFLEAFNEIHDFAG